jgi:hypothetical protein
MKKVISRQKPLKDSQEKRDKKNQEVVAEMVKALNRAAKKHPETQA